MKPQHIKTAVTLIVLFSTIYFPIPALAQIDGFPDNGMPDAPIDGGLSLLVAAGVGYGAKKLKARNILNRGK